MSSSRRDFLSWISSTATTAVLASCADARPGVAAAAPPPAPPRIEALAFDAFVLFDPRPITALADQLFPGKGAELVNAWRVRQFDYSWLRCVAGHYKDFWQVTGDALAFAAGMLRLPLDREKRDRLLDAHLALRAWPDVAPALRELRRSGRRLAILSNWSPNMLAAGIEAASLRGYFDHVISTDQVQSYKPDPRAYRLAMDTFQLDLPRIGFVASSGWDAAGSRWFGYRTFWVNRPGLPPDALGAEAHTTVADAAELVKVL